MSLDMSQTSGAFAEIGERFARKGGELDAVDRLVGSDMNVSCIFIEMELRGLRRAACTCASSPSPTPVFRSDASPFAPKSEATTFASATAFSPHTRR